MNIMYVSAGDVEKVLSGKQKYCMSNFGPVDKRTLKKNLKDTKKTLKDINKRNKAKCKTCMNFSKDDPCDISNYSYQMSKVCLDCGRGFEWKNYKSKEIKKGAKQ